MWSSGARALGLIALAAATACRAPESRPSILLVVLDTVRADAVSAYGVVSGTTPQLDALSQRGLLYTHAFSNGAWTVPSHASLFTGQHAHQHGVSWRRPVASDDTVLLAERLRLAGYHTYGISENPWLRTANLDQGFEHYESALRSLPEIEPTLRRWFSDGIPPGPIFLFVNLIDPHWPYSAEGASSFLPEGVSLEEASGLSQWPPDYMCRPPPDSRALAIQHGLYHAEVAASDAKLGTLWRLLEELGATRDLIAVVTSDHGEHFGEKGIIGHQFSVYQELLHVPLVVYGAPGASPARIDEPVQLADVFPSLLSWVGLPVPEGLAGRALPTTVRANAPARSFVAQFEEPYDRPTSEEPPAALLARQNTLAMRARCTPDDPVWGGMRTLVRYPLKLVAFDRYATQLFHLGRDPGERDDLAERVPRLTAYLQVELDAHLREQSEPDAEATLEPEVERELESVLEVAGGRRSRPTDSSAESPDP